MNTSLKNTKKPSKSKVPIGQTIKKITIFALSGFFTIVLSIFLFLSIQLWMKRAPQDLPQGVSAILYVSNDTIYVFRDKETSIKGICLGQKELSIENPSNPKMQAITNQFCWKKIEKNYYLFDSEKSITTVGYNLEMFKKSYEEYLNHVEQNK